MSENILSKLIDHVPTRLVTLNSILIFQIEDGSFIGFEGDTECCAQTDFSDYLNFDTLINNKIIKVDIPKINTGICGFDVEFCSISSNKGTATFHFKTSHNGYYSGWIINSTKSQEELALIVATEYLKVFQ